MTNPAHLPTRHAGRGHLKALDGVRGLAIVMVLASHAFVSNYHTHGALVHFIAETLHFGISGVDLFFVLSGFLITGILLDTRSDPGFFRKFYGRRVLRIFPLYYGVLGVLFILTPFLHFQWNGMGWLYLFDLQNWRAFESENFVLSGKVGLFHFWSLAIEEQFYFLWPAVVFLVPSRRVLVRVTLALCACALLLRLGLIVTGLDVFAVRVNTFCRADALMAGGLLAMLYRSAAWDRAARLAPAALLATLAILIPSLYIQGDRSSDSIPRLLWTEGFEYTLLAFASTCLLAWALTPGSMPEHFFSASLLRFFGKYSYGIYVLHVIFLTLLEDPLRTLLRELTHSKGAAVVLAGVLSIALSIGAAVVSFHLYEKQFLRMKRLFDYSPVAPKA